MHKEEQFDWRAGNALWDAGDVAGFWRAYGGYLERVGVVSNARVVIHRAAKLTERVLGELEKGVS
jgi:hypothetical protein